MKRIKSIELRNSSFFDDIKIEFSEKLNCLMGGRGTGKSSLLFFLKSTLSKDSENDKAIHDLLKSNLGGGEIVVEMESESGEFFRITKTFLDDPQPYKYPNSEFVPIDKIFEFIECDFYETGKIEKIGRQKEDRLKLIDKKVQIAINEEVSSLREIQMDLASNAQDIKSFELRISRISDSLAQYQDAEVEFSNHKELQPSGLLETEKQEFELADDKEKSRRLETRSLNRFREDVQNIISVISAQISESNATLNRMESESSSFVNKSIMDEIFTGVRASMSSIVQKFEQAKELGSAQLKTLDQLSLKLVESHEIQQAEFVKLKQKFDSHRDYINRYNLLSKRVSDKENLLKDLKELKDKSSGLESKRKSLVNDLNNIKQRIFTIRHRAIVDLNGEFRGDILITLTESGNTTLYEDKLRDALKGSGLRYNELIPRIVETFRSDELATLVRERDIDKLKNVTGIDAARSETIVKALFQTDAIYDIESTYSDDLPEFKLKIHSGDNAEENYRNSDELSMGQRCTTVLPIIFAVSDNPLIIDQPEDNLDNKYISDQIHEIIKRQKLTRQLILITHNPNIPVLSESERNIFLRYDKKASVETVGTVDEVKLSIVDLLEGGEAAFTRRRIIYGY